MTSNITLTRCGYTAIIGAPNAGKSTLLNKLVGSKIAIVSPKVQTTRTRILGIVPYGTTQLIFVDTPGIFKTHGGESKQKKFEQSLVTTAWEGAQDADVTLLLIDAAQYSYRGVLDEDTQTILNTLKARNTPVALALNKVDQVKKPQLLQMVTALNHDYEFTDVFMISAKTGDGLEELLEHLAETMPQSPWLYPEDQMTDVPLRELASEITREQLFFKLQQELPYALMVETENWEEQKDGSVKIRQCIMVMRDSQKKIVLGKNGEMLKTIGSNARREISRVIGQKTHLFLFVKVQPDWIRV